MGWSGSLTENSALGSSVTFTPGTSTEGAYTVSSFTAPRKGVYKFELKGSGGTAGTASGGKGGLTTGYLLLEKNQTVYIGAGGTCSAAFVSSSSGTKLSAVARANLYFVAGGGGGGGRSSYYANHASGSVTAGGNGGGSSGAAASSGGSGGTQSAGGAAGTSWVDGTAPAAGAYGAGGSGGRDSASIVGECKGGRGGDGYFGGGGGGANASSNSATGVNNGYAMGGGGGSGYVKTATLTVLSRVYTSTTSQSGGAESNTNGSVKVTYHARAELPVRFDGAMIERLFFNGAEVSSLVFNGVKLFMRRWARCLQ